MKAFRMFLVTTTAALAVSAVAHANGVTSPAEATSTDKAVYEGTDAQGRIVHLTIPNLGVTTLIQVSPVAHSYPDLNWTARIGAGNAGALKQ